MGQFTGLFSGLEKAETKPQTKAKASKTENRSSDRKTAEATTAPPAKALQPAKTKPEAKKPSRNGTAAKIDAPAPIRGKRSHPDYTQAPAFVRKDTYKAVKIALLNDERGLNYSDLIEELLTAWLTNKR